MKKGWVTKEQSVWGIYNGQVKALRNQGLTLQAIGDRVGVTKERIRQILVAHYGTTEVPGFIVRERLAGLLGCSSTYLLSLEKQGVLNPIHSGSGGYRLYDRDESEKAALAVAQMRQNGHWVKLVCDECGRDFKRERSQVTFKIKKGQKLWFCSRHCLGKYTGQHYGFTAHPENAGWERGRSRKWDWGKVYKMREETGWGALRIGRALGIPVSTVSAILRRAEEYHRSEGER